MTASHTGGGEGPEVHPAEEWREIDHELAMAEQAMHEAEESIEHAHELRAARKKKGIRFG